VNINQALLAAKASLNEVTHLETLEKIREPFTSYRKDHPFVEFVEQAFGDQFPFTGESAHIVTYVPRMAPEDLSNPEEADLLGQPAAKLRIIRRGSGRSELTLKSVPIEVRATAPPFMILREDGQILEGTDRSLVSYLGSTTQNRIEYFVLWSLAASAREQGKVTVCDLSALRNEVITAIEFFGESCTVVAHHGVIGKLLENRHLGYEMGGLGNVVPSHVIGANNVVVVVNRPRDVGFVRITHETTVYCAPNSTFDIECVAMTRCGFCAWGDAPLRWFDCGSAV